MRAESATAVLGLFIAIALVIGTLSYPAHPPAETLLAPERERTLDTTSPVIFWTSPAHGQGAYPNADIVVQFNESMNTSSFSYEFIQGWDPGMNWSWESIVYENDTVRGTHDVLFGSTALYEFNVTYAEDVAGNALVPGPVPNPWNWSVIVVIVETIPADGETNVSLSQDIIIFFSGPVDPLTWPIDFWTIFPDHGGAWVVTWNPDAVALYHGTPFESCTLYHVLVQIGFFPFPSLVPNPWSFTTTCEYPYILRTDPFDGETGVGLWKEIVIEFDEPINVSMPFVFDVAPEIPGTVWTTIWNNDTTVTLNHSLPLVPASQITVDVLEAYDLDGNPLVQGPVPNPFSFYTNGCPGPWIEETNPPDMAIAVPLDEPIIVVFSETMDINSVTWDVYDLGGPSPITFTPSWNQTVWPDDTLTLSHVTPFDEWMTYYVLIDGQDLDGNPLDPGPVPNPWSFTTVCPAMPMIARTDPAPGEVNVPLNKSIILEFNKEIDPASFVWIIDPNPGGWTEAWSNNNTTVTLDHSVDFDQCTVYTVQVTQAMDVDGFPLVPGPWPNPWSFITMCISPYIVSTDPHDGESGVPLDHNITVVFSEPMNPASVTCDIYYLNPKETTGITFTWTWLNNDTRLQLHPQTPFQESRTVQVWVNGSDTDGYDLIPNPGPFPISNPWVFMTLSVNPTILSTYPPDGGTDVPLDAPIMVNFSEPMNAISISLSIDPDPGGWGPFEWNITGTSFSWNHLNDYATCTLITVTIHTAKDLAGLDLVPLPYTWSFLTACPNPFLVFTVPAHDATDVELNRSVDVEFSDPMNTASVAWTIDPDPGGWSQSWADNDTMLTLSHANLFDYGSTYTFEVTGGQDKDGFPLISGLVPNPWSWTTGPKTPAPPTNVSAFLSGPSLRDVTVTWQLSEDDFPGGNVSYYDVLRGDAYDRDGAGYGFLGSVPSGASQYVDLFAGLDGNCHYYFVCSAQFGVEPNCSENQAGKFTRPLTAGPNLVSVPLIPSDESVETVLQTVKYDMASYYDTSSGEWRWHMTAKEYGGLTNLDPTMGLWVNVTEASSLTVAGMVPAQTMIHLRSGWNLVSFPSFNSSYTVADLKAELPVERVEGFDASAPPHFLRVLQDSDVLLAGRGYWVKVSQDATWVVRNG